MDLFDYKGFKFLIVVDSFSRWLEVSTPLSNTTANDIIPIIMNLFAMFGEPLAIVTDNGPPFRSQEFDQFCVERNIVLLHSPPYHPPANGSAEKSVSTAKNFLKKTTEENCSKIELVKLVIEFKQTHNNTPCSVTGIPPSKHMLAFKPKTVLSSIHPQMSDLFHVKVPNYQINEKVRYRTKKGAPVQFGVVQKILGKTTYIIKIEDKLHLVSVNQLNKCEEAPPVIHDCMSKDPDYKHLYEQLLKMQLLNKCEEAPPVIHDCMSKDPDYKHLYEQLLKMQFQRNQETPALDNDDSVEINNDVPVQTNCENDKNVNVRRSGRATKPNQFITDNYVTK
ncbi:hypothetical protein KUF71_018675 [Frankliniella fusca]|uniref:Integrase catalytic domain-containing protein n=1 Tax=Frankliniella fusca TaxID=407009 RepID=A0AAE1GSK5_9NEOP|nr:hypothetical protein KUF71_018675 [Frankliniella fusca]